MCSGVTRPFAFSAEGAWYARLAVIAIGRAGRCDGGVSDGGGGGERGGGAVRGLLVLAEEWYTPMANTAILIPAGTGILQWQILLYWYCVSLLVLEYSNGKYCYTGTVYPCMLVLEYSNGKYCYTGTVYPCWCWYKYCYTGTVYPCMLVLVYSNGKYCYTGTVYPCMLVLVYSNGKYWYCVSLLVLDGKYCYTGTVYPCWYWYTPMANTAILVLCIPAGTGIKIDSRDTQYQYSSICHWSIPVPAGIHMNMTKGQNRLQLALKSVEQPPVTS